MKLKTYILVFSFILASFIFISSANFTVKSDANYTYISYLTWYNSYDRAQAVAQEENKPIMVYFWAPWCKWCKLIEGEVFVEPKVNKMLNESFVLVAVNVDYDKNTTKRFNIYNSAIILFLDKDGNRLRTTGYMPPSEFLKLASHILEVTR